MRYDFSTNEYVYTRVNGSVYRCKDSFPSIVQPFWQNDPKEFDLEKKITWDEIAPSLQELIIRKIKFSDLDDPLQNRIIKIETDIVNNYTNLNNRLLAEVQNRTDSDGLLQDQIDSLKRRMTSAESRLTVLENRMDEAERQIYLLWIEIRKLWEEIYDIWGSDGKDNSHNITEIWKKIGELEQEISNLWGKLGEAEDSITEVEKKIKKMKVDITRGAESRNTAGNEPPINPGECSIRINTWETDSSNEAVKTNIETYIHFYVNMANTIVCYLSFVPVNYNIGASERDTLDLQSFSVNLEGVGSFTYETQFGYVGSPYPDVPVGYCRLVIHTTNPSSSIHVSLSAKGTVDLVNFNPDIWPSGDLSFITNNLSSCFGQGQSFYVSTASSYMSAVALA